MEEASIVLFDDIWVLILMPVILSEKTGRNNNELSFLRQI